MVFNDTDGLYTYTFEAEKKVNNNNNYYQNTTKYIGHHEIGKDDNYENLMKMQIKLRF